MIGINKFFLLLLTSILWGCKADAGQVEPACEEDRDCPEGFQCAKSIGSENVCVALEQDTSVSDDIRDPMDTPQDTSTEDAAQADSSTTSGDISVDSPPVSCFPECGPGAICESGTCVCQEMTVLQTIPAFNDMAGALDTGVVVTFSCAVDKTTVTPESARLFGEFTGLYTTSVEMDEPHVMTLVPSVSLFPNERIQVSLTSSITSDNGVALSPTTFQYWAEVLAGDGEFTESSDTLDSAPAGSWSSVGDLDGDRQLDFWMGGNLWLQDSGNGLFGAPLKTIHADFTGPLIAQADFDADGDLDLLSQMSSGGMMIFTNDGNAQFTPTGQTLVPAQTSIPPHEPSVGDVDGDGNLDLLFKDSIWLNNGTGLFQQSLSFFEEEGFLFGPNGSGLGDIDSDGDLDIVFSDGFRVGGGSSGPLSTLVETWSNDGGGSDFTRVSSDSVDSSEGWRIVIADFDGDGHVDVVSGGVLWRNDGVGLLTNTGQALSNDSNLLDVDDDGHLDVLFRQENAAALRLNNAGIFTQSPFDLTHSQFGTGRSMGMQGDVNGDGAVDIIAIYTNALAVWHGTPP